MAQAFNPYLEWLGITSSGSSPNYYDLLGLPALEADLGKINAAYQRQSSRLASHLTGSQAAVAQRLMNELAEARMTLMTPTAKRAYDQTIAARGATASLPAAAPSEISTAANIDDMLPPAAAPQAADVPGYPTPAPQPYPAQPVPAQVPGNTSYGAPHGYAVPQGQPIQGYPAWQGQPAGAPPSYPPAGYYPGAQAVVNAEPAPAPTEPMPAIRRRPARRRSSPAPAVIATAIVIVAALGGVWYYFNGNPLVAVVQPTNRTDEPSRSGRSSNSPSDRSNPSQVETPEKDHVGPQVGLDGRTISPDAGKPETTDGDSSEVAMPDNNKPAMEMPVETTKPEPEKPQTDVTQRDPPKPNETKAGPEEAAAVAKALNDVRAALAKRDLAKATELLDEATIEASASDSLAAVKRVETLTNYVEMFWDAARKTLPKLQAAETIEIDGKMVAIVEADEEHLIVRIKGNNKEYRWKEIPRNIAYYLADRWLSKGEPIRNLVLASFEIVEPKGDLDQAQVLLDAASAARLDVRPLVEELKLARDHDRK